MRRNRSKDFVSGINHPINFTIEPMIVDSWVLNVNLNFVNGTEYLRNSAFSGFSNCTIMSASYNPQNYTLVYTSYYPHILETGFSYNWGTISFEDGSTDAIYGRGGYDRHLYGSNITHRITFVPVHRDHGVEYLQVQRYELDSYGVRDTSVHWQNLYEGDTIRANRAFNRLAQNPMEIGAAVEGTLREGMTNMFRLYTEQLISSVPLRQLRRHFVNHS
ncbi:unnamed protein product [Phaedon cochleariae]|uniref:Uncharacterized protein n=1 Tax=Phaedon cochleariae TaxID=80249 RepID=A0A9N9X3A7_PHACE|nr:unnamed protein product [Phaedon cochleariae]